MGKQIYLDYCATTPVHADVRAAMQAALAGSYGNPSSMHWAGRAAAKLLDETRTTVADVLGCQAEEVYFTSGATEADNLALLGVMHCYSPGMAHLITSTIEHHAVLHTAEFLESEGYAVTYLPVDRDGLIDLDKLERAIRPETVLISIMAVNNEVGVIQPLEEIGRLARSRGILFHSDAVQGLGMPNLNVKSWNIDLLALSAHKIYGPKGVGVLMVRQGVALKPMMHGGSQERHIRPGTENVPGIAGLGAAIKLMAQKKVSETLRIQALRQRLLDGLRQIAPDLIVNGSQAAGAAHILSVSFPGVDAEMMLIRLNGEGIAVSMGSACTSKDVEPSHVLSAMHLPRPQIETTLRISLGIPTTDGDIQQFLERFSPIYTRVRMTT